MTVLTFAPHVHCSFPDHRRRDHECGEPGAALLRYPSGRRDGRCQLHAEVHEALIRTNAMYSEYSIEWLDR